MPLSSSPSALRVSSTSSNPKNPQSQPPPEKPFNVGGLYFNRPPTPEGYVLPSFYPMMMFGRRRDI